MVPLVLIGAVLAWLAGDFFLFHGPLHRSFSAAGPSGSGAVVARVFHHQITRGQLDRAVRERLWLEGKAIESLAPEPLKAIRQTALDELIDHELLRAGTEGGDPQPKVSDEEVNERLRRLLGRFETRSEMESAMKSQGIPGERDLRDRIAARIRQEKFLETRVEPLSRVTDEEARQWFEEHRKAFAIPERVEARHIFLPTLDHPPEEAKAKLEAALADLSAGKKDFATLARELSEDPATKNLGGSLGWMTRNRLPVDFAAPVFSLAPGKPTLVRSRLGWHLVEVTARKPAEPRTFESAKPEVLAALQAVKRSQALKDCRAALRKSAASEIRIFPDVMD